MTVRTAEPDTGALTTSVLRGTKPRLVRIACWFVAIALGAVHAWVTRFTMYPDGVSYLDLGDAIWRGDWHNAINAYWSPLYPTVAGMFLNVFRPAMADEYPLVHLVNFLIYVAALICFEYFFSTFLEHQRSREGGGESGLPVWAWYVTGYSAFISSSLLLIGINFVSGDMAVAAVLYVACALLLNIGAVPPASCNIGNKWDTQGWKIFACLGLVLGIGYLAKAVMFVLSLSFFAVAAAIQHKLGKSMKPVAVSILVFGLISGPWVLAISKAKRRPTFGDSGKVNYAMNVGAVNFLIPMPEGAAHPLNKIAGLPAYEYGQPIGGTYPLWYDPSYWHEGIQPHFSLKKQVFSILTSLLSLGWISFNVLMALNISVAMLFLYLTTPNISAALARARSNWILWIPALSGIALYSLVVIEPRYVGALFCLLWIVALSGLRFTASSRKLISVTAVLMAITTCAVEAWQISRAFDPEYFAERHVASPVSVKIAAAIQAKGLQPGDKVAVVGDWLVALQETSYVARLARVRIVGEARPHEFWSATSAIRNSVVAEFSRAGAKGILTVGPPKSTQPCEQLAGSGYYLCWIRDAK